MLTELLKAAVEARGRVPQPDRQPSPEALDLFKDWTPEMLEEIKHSGKGSAWKRMTPREIAKFRQTMRMVHFKKTPEEQLKWIGKSAESIRETWANKTSEQKEEFRMMVKAQWGNRTKEERACISNKISATVKKIWRDNPEVYSVERNMKISKSIREVWAGKSTEEMEKFKARCSEATRKTWAGLTPEERDNWIKRCLEGQKRKPSLPELLVGGYLERNFPDEWLYTGNGKAGIVIGRKVPDFYNINGKKQVIEVLGAIGFYHSLEDGDIKKAHYKKFGYECIIIFEWDCFPDRLDEIFGIKV